MYSVKSPNAEITIYGVSLPHVLCVINLRIQIPLWLHEYDPSAVRYSSALCVFHVVSVEAKTFDDVLCEIGEFGRYQQQQFFLVSLVVMSGAVIILMPVFTFDTPPHRSVDTRVSYWTAP